MALNIVGTRCRVHSLFHVATIGMRHQTQVWGRTGWRRLASVNVEWKRNIISCFFSLIHIKFVSHGQRIFFKVCLNVTCPSIFHSPISRQICRRHGRKTKVFFRPSHRLFTHVPHNDRRTRFETSTNISCKNIITDGFFRGEIRILKQPVAWLRWWHDEHGDTKCGTTLKHSWVSIFF